jgi:circadian clock protein KaiC
VLSNQVCFHHVAAGQRALYVTLLAENHARMLDNLRQMSFFDESRIPDHLIYLSAFRELSEGGLPALMNLLRREVQRRRATLLVIDGLVSVQATAASDQDFKQFIHDLQEVALATDCTMLLTTNTHRAASPEQTMVDGMILLTDRLQGWRAESDLQVTKFRGSAFLRGRHSYRITGDGLVLFPRIEALYAQPSREAPVSARLVATGLPQLDAMLGGGLPEGSTTLAMGPSGIGKTTLGLHFLAAASADEPGLMFGFYETPARLRAKAERFGHLPTGLFDDGPVELHWQPPPATCSMPMAAACSPRSSAVGSSACSSTACPPSTAAPSTPRAPATSSPPWPTSSAPAASPPSIRWKRRTS